MNLTEIQDLIKFVARSGVTEVEIEQNNFKITIKSEGKRSTRSGDQPEMYMQPAMAMPNMIMPQAMAAPPIQPPAPIAQPQAPPATPAPETKSNLITIKSPMIGTFYRASGPDKPSFINVGDSIKAGKVICIIEAMKLFNEIESEISGKIVKVLVDDASPVEYDQPLFLVEPA